jgi:hypothetical protein
MTEATLTVVRLLVGDRTIEISDGDATARGEFREARLG